MSSYLVLLQVGFTLPRTVTSRAVRSYRTISTLPVVNYLGGLFSAALSVGSRPPGVTWHFTLRSPDFPPPLTRRRLPSQLATRILLTYEDNNKGFFPKERHNILSRKPPKPLAAGNTPPIHPLRDCEPLFDPCAHE